MEYAEEVYRITPTASGKGLSLLCPTRKVLNRGDTLNLSTLTIDLEPAFDGCISVETTHWRGAVQRGPDFDLFPDGRPPVESQIAKSDDGATVLSSGSLSAAISGKPHEFEISFQPTDNKKKRLTALQNRSVGLAYTPAPTSPMQLADMGKIHHYILTQTTISVGESIHGLGERFGPFNKVGQTISLWNSDGGTSSDQAYKNISFFMSSKGYGIFIDTPERVELEMGSERCCRAQASVEGQRLKWYLIYGPTPRDILRRYAILTGLPGTVPAWSFGLWLSTSFTTSYDEETVNKFLAGMQARDIPVEVFHYDCFWLKAFQWCDFTFDDDMFPDPKGQIARLKASGSVKKICVWTNTYLGQASPLFAEAASKGYLLRRKNGDVFQWDLWQAGMGIVDLTNPAASEWFLAQLERLFDLGVDCIKTDFGERIPSIDVEWHDKSVSPARMHNYYSFLYNQLVYTALQRRYGRNGAVLFARSATAGSQRFPLGWGGDCESTPEAMAESIRGGLSLGLSGFAFWSVDIGGFEGYPEPWIYKRWVAWGLLCSHSRLHGSNSYRVPWTVDDDDKSAEGCSAVLAGWTHLRIRLMPYLFAQAQSAMRNGLPLSLRAMCIEFPDDPTAWTLDRQFMLGDSLLVAPVMEEDNSVQFYLPRGRWTNFFSGEVKAGPQWVEETHHSFRTLPLYVRENTLLVLGPEGERRIVYDYAADVEVRSYSVREGAKAEIVDGEGRVVVVLEASGDGEILHKETLKGNCSFSVVS